MKKILLAVLSVTILGMFAGCQPYHTESNTTFSNVAPIERGDLQLHINKAGNNLEFTVTENEYTVEADECILRNDNTHELYANFGDYENIIYTLNEDGYYTFGFYKDNIEIIYSFKLSELKETQVINY